jgi:hypothetical protein
MWRIRAEDLARFANAKSGDGCLRCGADSLALVTAEKPPQRAIPGLNLVAGAAHYSALLSCRCCGTARVFNADLVAEWVSSNPA